MWKDRKLDQSRFLPRNVYLFPCSLHDALFQGQDVLMWLVGYLSGNSSLSRKSSYIHLSSLIHLRDIVALKACLRRKVILPLSRKITTSLGLCIILSSCLCRDADASVHHLVTALLSVQNSCYDFIAFKDFFAHETLTGLWRLDVALHCVAAH